MEDGQPNADTFPSQLLWLSTLWVQLSEKSWEYFTLVISICTASYNDDIFPLIGLTYTVECRYNVVQYNMILYTSLHWLRQSINQSEEPQNTLDSSPRQGEVWGVFCGDFGENLPRYNSTALYMASLAGFSLDPLFHYR